jgi:biopolymer transport protein ExbD
MVVLVWLIISALMFDADIPASLPKTNTSRHRFEKPIHNVKDAYAVVTAPLTAAPKQRI